MRANNCRRSANVVRSAQGWWIGLVFSFAVPVWGSPPSQPLQPPLYSFDSQSPTVLDGTLSADSVLQLGDPSPVSVTDGIGLGLGQPGDQIDALSSNHIAFPAAGTFSVLFSVDRATVGVMPPDPALVAQGVPFSVQDQAAKGQAAGDQFISLTIFQFGINARGGRMLGSGSNNSQVRNNFDEGGTDFAAKPPTTSSSSSSSPQDNVNSTSGTAAAALMVAGVPAGIYYSLCRDPLGTCDSPSLATLSSVVPSGASLFFHPSPGSPGVSPRLFADFSNLGLQQDDDINAVVVMDVNGDGQFNGADRVVYSLAPGSPSLSLLPGASAVGASADIYVASPGGVVTLLAPAANLGLGAPSDNIDALDLLPCTDGLGCALAHGMRAGEIPTVSAWGVVVLVLLLLSCGAVIIQRGGKISCVGQGTS